jgi:hypothetical protein
VTGTSSTDDDPVRDGNTTTAIRWPKNKQTEPVTVECDPHGRYGHQVPVTFLQ